MKRIGKKALVLIVLLLAALAAGAAHAESALITDVASEAELRSALENNAPWIRLTEDILLSEMLEFGEGAVIDMTLDLNGHTLSRKLEAPDQNGHVIYVREDATINIVNSDTQHRGVITGGYAYEGAGILNRGVVTLKGVTLSGNTAHYPNSTISDGSAIRNVGTMYLEDVIVTENTVLDGRKGAAVYNVGELYVSDIIVTGNEGNTVGGLYNYGYLYVSGKLVFTENTGAGLELHNFTVLDVIGAISSESRIDIMRTTGIPVTSGYSIYNPTLSPSEVFFPSDETQHVLVQDDEVIFRTGVDYVERSWDGERVVAETKVCYDYTPILTRSSVLKLKEGWYIAEGKREQTGPVEVIGDVHLILLDGASFTFNQGVHVGAGSSLTIYGQFDVTSDGITAGSGSMTVASAGDNMAGIGGSSGEAAGSITVHGGNVYVLGGLNAPGLGSGADAPSGTEQRITVYDGMIYSFGGANASGVGNGRNSDGARLTVYGGRVAAIAGSEGVGAFGLDADPTTAIDRLSIPGDFKVTYQDSSVDALEAPGAERERYAQTHRVAVITVCGHEQLGLRSISDTEHAIVCPSCTLVESRSAHVLGETRIGVENHYAICEVCGDTIATAHDFGEKNLCACGASRIHVSFAPGEGAGEAYTVDGTTLADFEMPENAFTAPTGKWFAGWRKEGTGKLYGPGTTQVFTEAENVTFTAVWSGETWAVLQNRINEAGTTATVALSGDVFAAEGDGPLVIPAGKNITLDLGAYTLSRNLSESADRGSAIIVDGTLTLKGSAGSLVTGGHTTDVGGGIYVNFGASLRVEGCEIGGNHADYAGGAVAIMGGEVSMSNGAKIAGNSAAFAGGGVALISGSLTMDGAVTVTENISDFVGGGVAVLNDSSFAVRGSVEIYDNQRRVVMPEDDELSGDDIYLGVGTVLDVKGRLTKTHPYVVTTEVLAEYGKPVYITSGLAGNGSAEDFRSVRPGEDVVLDDAKGEAVLAVEMVEINYLPGSGTGEEKVQHTPDGTELVLPGNDYGYTPPENTTFSGWHRVGEAENIVYRPGDKIVLDGDTELVARYAYKWAYLQEMFNEGATIVLQGDTVAEASDTFLVIPEGVTVDLDLNGFAIDRNMQSRHHMGCVICVNGELILRDSSKAQSGSIRGGWLYRAKESSYRSGCAFDINGKLTMYGGNITGNRDENLSIVSVNNKAKFIMYGGSIHDNRASTTVSVNEGGNFAQYGGEIRDNISNVTTIGVHAPVLLEGGSVSHNTSYGYGGAYTLYYHRETKLSINGGKIVGNVGKTGGGIAQQSTVGAARLIHLSGSPVIEDNTYENGLEGDICIRDPNSILGEFTGINVTGPLGEDVRIGVRFTEGDNNRIFTQGLSGRGKAENFFSNAGDAVALDDSTGEAMMGTSATLFFAPGEGGSGKMLPLHKVVGMSVIMPENGFTPPEGLVFVAWEDEDGKLYFPGEQLVARNQMTLKAVWARSKWQLLTQQLELARGKTIVLMEDLTADASLGDGMLVVPAGATAILDLNGHTLYRAPVGNEAEDSVISVAGTLTIRDSSEEKTGAILSGAARRSASAIRNTGTLTVEGGAFDGFNTTQNGAAIWNGGTLTITGGTFENNQAEHGGAIYNDGTLTISGGTLDNNTASETGGIIHNANALTITGGTLSHGKAHDGGAIYNDAAGTVRFTNGTIESSRTTGGNGGGICNAGTLNVSGGIIQYNLVSASGAHGAGVWNGGTMNLTGGTIALNQCCNRYNYGGGVYVHPDSTLNVSGNPQVFDNSYDDIHLTDGVTMNITDTLGADARIGVNCNNLPALEDPIEITRGLPAYRNFSNFFTNNETQLPLSINDEGALVFGAPVTVYFRIDPGDDSSGNMENLYTAYGATITLPEYGYPMPENKSFVGWEIKDVVYHPGETLRISTDTVEGVTVLAWATWETTPWTALQSWLNTTQEGTYIMAEDVVASPENGAMTIPLNTTATIDLNGHTLDRGLTTAVANGSVIVNNGTLTIRDSSTDKTGAITGAKNTGSGGGIVNNGTLYIESGNIRGNSAKEAGAVMNNSSAMLSMTGGSLTANSTTEWGGGAIVNYGYMIIRDGTISGNTSVGNGAGIWTGGTLSLYGGTITGNQSTKSTSNGGGVYFKEGTIYVGGEPRVLDNLPNNLHMLAGEKLTILETMGESADIHVDMEEAPTSIKRVIITSGLGGKGSVSSFTHDSAVYPILVNGSGEAVLSSYAVFHFDADGGSGTAPSTVTQSIPGAIDMPANNPFTAPEGKIFVGWMIGSRIYLNSERYVFDHTTLPSADVVVKAVWATSDWNALNQLFLYGGSRTITLTKDVIASANEGIQDDVYLYVAAGKEITLDLNGHTLSRGLDRSNMPYSAGYVIAVGGTLTILDSSPTHTGKITGGASRNNGGCIAVGGTLNIHDATITGNYARGSGAGVYIGSENGVVNMYSGKITGNTAGDTGGGVRLWGGTFNMYGGTISGNTAGTQGGGMFTVSGGKFNLYGGTLTGNTAGSGGGGVYMNSGTLNVSGDPQIRGNTLSGTNAESNIHFKVDDTRIGVVGPLDPMADIGVTVNKDHIPTLTNGLPGNGTRGNFHADQTGYNIWIGEDGEALIGVKSFLSFDPGEGGSGSMPDIVVDDGATIVMPECGFTAPEGKQFLCWKVDDGTFLMAGEEYLPTTICTVTAIWDVVPATPWIQLQQLINASTGSGVVKLKDDVTALAGEAALTVPEGVNVVIDLNGHTIDRARARAEAAGSVFIVEGGALTLRDTSEGEMGQVTGGRTTGSGGGVRVSSGALYMEGGTITGNEASNSWGGGVYLYSTNSYLHMSGGHISGNTAGRNGGGVHVSEGALLDVSGHGVIWDNTKAGVANNVNLASDSLVHVAGKLEKSAYICVSSSVTPTAAAPVAITDGFAGRGALSNFSTDRGDGMIKLMDNGEAGVHVQITLKFAPGEGASGSMPNATYTISDDLVLPEPTFTAPSGKVFGGWQVNDSLEIYDAGEAFSANDERFGLAVNTLTATWADSAWAALNMKMAKAAEGPVTVRLTRDVKALGSDEPLSVPAATTVTLDLNGYTLDRGLTSARLNGNAIIVSGTLDLVDTSASQKGRITGAYNDGYGGCIVIAPGGCLNMYGGTISGNHVIYSLSSSLLAGMGGGVYIYQNAEMHMYGGTITRNYSEKPSAGVHIVTRTFSTVTDKNAVFTIGGSAKIYGNDPGDVNFVSVDKDPENMWTFGGDRIKIDRPLSDDARIAMFIESDDAPGDDGAEFVTDGLAGKGTLDNFSLTTDGYTLVLGTDGEIAIVRKQEFPMTGFEIPAMITGIEEEAFAGLTIDSVFISDNCHSIGPGAFRDCSRLKRVCLPKNCDIDDTAFDGCASEIWLYVPRGGTTQTWAENYALTHSCIIYLTDN